jgi:hypothetical protein
MTIHNMTLAALLACLAAAGCTAEVATTRDADAAPPLACIYADGRTFDCPGFSQIYDDGTLGDCASCSPGQPCTGPGIYDGGTGTWGVCRWPRAHSPRRRFTRVC